jgi:hypothetical protein
MRATIVDVYSTMVVIIEDHNIIMSVNVWKRVSEHDGI